MYTYAMSHIDYIIVRCVECVEGMQILVGTLCKIYGYW